MPDDSHRGSASSLVLALLVACAVVALIAQFGLDDWASQSELGDWVQHGLLFWAGIGAGAAVVTLYRSGRRVV